MTVSVQTDFDRHQFLRDRLIGGLRRDVSDMHRQPPGGGVWRDRRIVCDQPLRFQTIGEQTGKLDEMLLNAAETFDAEADIAINRFVSIFPAILILLLALVIGFIVAATLLPIITMELGATGG